MVNPGLIHNNKSTHKISFIFVKMLQALFRNFHASVFLICCEQARHPSCAKLFHIQFFTQNISYMLFWNAYSLSNFMHFHLPVIQYRIVHLFDDFWCCCTFWTSFTWIIFKAGTSTFKLGSPFLNCWKRRRRVPINFMNFEWISFGVKPSFTKNFETARYSILSISRNTDNTPASDSCIKQTA